MNHKNNIEQTGLSIMGVFGSDTSPSFAYTIGLTETQKAPELMIFGLPNKYSALFLNQLADKMKNGTRFKDGDIIEDLANMPMIIKNVPVARAKEFAFQTFYYYEGTGLEPEFQIAVIPDKNGVFPWEPDFDPKMKYSQPHIWMTQ